MHWIDSIVRRMIALVLLGGYICSALPAFAAKPNVEPAYVDGRAVVYTATPVPPTSRIPADIQGALYLVVYPNGWETLGIGTPQCNPCDHSGDGVDFTDFHDHILNSAPGDGYSPLRQLYLVVPAYNGDSTHDALVTAAYATYIPTTSEDEVEALLAATLSDGLPIATLIDTGATLLTTIVEGSARRAQ